MTNKEKKTLQSVSRLLAKTLRHAPGDLGLALGENGWVDVPTLLEALARKGYDITRDQLAWIVATNDKQRFTLSPDGGRIRAAQGHSVAVDLALVAALPPAVLFHGTAVATIPLIRKTGLIPGQRHHVHLSARHDTALSVGRRHGDPVVLRIETAALVVASQQFFQADNGGWLTGPIDPQYLNFAEADALSDPAAHKK